MAVRGTMDMMQMCTSFEMRMCFVARMPTFLEQR